MTIAVALAVGVRSPFFRLEKFILTCANCSSGCLGMEELLGFEVNSTAGQIPYA